MGIKYRCSCIGVYLLCKGRCQPSRDVTSASLLVTKVGDRGSFGLLDSYKPTHFSGWVVDNALCSVLFSFPAGALLQESIPLYLFSYEIRNDQCCDCHQRRHDTAFNTENRIKEEAS